jgi:di/tripeptidase
MIQSVTSRTMLASTATRPAAAKAESVVDKVELGRVPAVDKDKVKDLFLELAQIPAATGNERKVADTLKEKLAALGYTPREDDAKSATDGNTGNLLLDIPATVPDAPGLIFMAHMDTVDLAQGVKPQIRDGVIYSDGSTALGADDRAGCAEILEALRLMKENDVPHGPIQIIFTVGEEGGLLGSSALKREDVHGQLGFAVDSFHPNDIFWGWDGPLFADERANAHHNKELAQKAFQRPRRAGEELHPRNNAEGFILDFARDGIRRIGMEPNERRLFGASSDAAPLRDMGIPAMTIGAGEQDIHTEDEHVAITDLGKSTELILTLMEKATQYRLDEQGKIVPR